MTVVDLCCSYGINAALPNHRLTFVHRRGLPRSSCVPAPYQPIADALTEHGLVTTVNTVPNTVSPMWTIRR
ncbi:hypothetical protein GCM10023192_62780 [Amycolatopsis samaneae]